MIDVVRLRRLIRCAVPAPLKINRYDNVSDINYQLQTTQGGTSEHEDYAVVANIRDDECPRAKPTAELILELYNHAEELADLQSQTEARGNYIAELEAQVAALQREFAEHREEAQNLAWERSEAIDRREDRDD